MFKENEIRELAKKTSSHEDWLTFVRFGMQTLLADQVLLMDVICNEAEKQLYRRNQGQCLRIEDKYVVNFIKDILKELGFKISMAT